MLEVKNLSAVYGIKSVLEKISFSLNRGELLVVIGSNGSGKSTLLRIIAGLQKNDFESTQSIFYDGKPINQYTVRKLAQLRSFVSQQELCIWEYTVEHFVRLGFYSHSNYNKTPFKHINQTLAKLNIDHLRNKKISCISGGEFARCVLARSFVQNADFLLLDEPFASLDIKVQHEVMQLLKTLATQKRGVFTSCHDINLASLYADKIMILCDQNILCIGTAKETITKKNIKQAFGIDAHIRLENEVPQIYVLPQNSCESKDSLL
ncbi:MAG: ABC transporter ATP-binding protein [Treponemataceae bacterium]